MTQRIDPAVPPNIVKQILGPDGIHPSQWNDELRDLMSPSIAARPLHLPESTRIKETKNREFHYHWAFDRCGSDPRHDRVEKLRGAGWDYATTADVEMCSADTVKQQNEIRIGDLRLMKIPLMRWREIRKAQNLAALQQIDPRRPNSVPMSLESMTPGLPHYAADDAEIRASAQVSDTTESRQAARKAGATETEIIANLMTRGNASTARIPKEK
jgi:hypothetical protein